METNAFKKLSIDTQIPIPTMKIKAILYLFLLILFVGCEKDVEPTKVDTTSLDVIILNEGNFGSGNASISIYNSDSKKVVNDVFRSNNQNRPLGDVVQSMYVRGDTAVIVVNNSQKIEVVQLSTFKSIGKISGLSSPRYILPIRENKAYVSDLYSNSLQKIDLKNFKLIKSISTNAWTESMEKIEDTAYVCDMTNNQLLLINTNTDSIFKRIQLIEQPVKVIKDKNNHLWVLCSGGFEKVNPRLYCLNSSAQILKDIVFSNIKDYPSNLTLNREKDELFYLNNGIFKMSINDNQLPAIPVISMNNRLFYGLSIHPSNNDIYVSDAIDYQQKGIVYRYNYSFQLIDQFKVGILPTNPEFLN